MFLRNSMLVLQFKSVSSNEKLLIRNFLNGKLKDSENYRQKDE